MSRTYHAAQVSLALSVFILASRPYPAVAETPGQIPQPWTYEGSKTLQEQPRQQDQPIFQPPGTSPQGGARTAPDAAASAAADAARRKWQSRAPLPPDRNPLLGRWMRPASTRANPNDPFGQWLLLPKAGPAKCCSAAVALSSASTDWLGRVSGPPNRTLNVAND